jgi:hypothetical protein
MDAAHAFLPVFSVAGPMIFKQYKNTVFMRMVGEDCEKQWNGNFNMYWKDSIPKSRLKSKVK